MNRPSNLYPRQKRKHSVRCPGRPGNATLQRPLLGWCQRCPYSIVCFCTRAGDAGYNTGFAVLVRATIRRKSILNIARPRKRVLSDRFLRSPSSRLPHPMFYTFYTGWTWGREKEKASVEHPSSVPLLQYCGVTWESKGLDDRGAGYNRVERRQEAENTLLECSRRRVSRGGAWFAWKSYMHGWRVSITGRPTRALFMQ